MPINSNETTVSIKTEYVFLIIFLIIMSVIIILLIRYALKDNKVVNNKDGNKSINKIESNDSNVNKNLESNKSNKKSNNIGKTILIFSLIIVVGFCAVKFGKFLFIRDLTAQDRQTSSITTRNATNNDVYIEINENLSSFSIDYKVKPNVDIENLQITCKFYNKYGEVVKTKVKKLGNVKKGVQFTFSISFSISDTLKISETRTSVTGGTVSIFAS